MGKHPSIPVSPLLEGDSANPVELVPLASMAVGDIQKLLDERLVSLNSEWKASIPFPLYPVEKQKKKRHEKKKQEYDCSIFGADIETLDICSYLNGQPSNISRLYFSPKKYPPPESAELMKGRAVDNNCQGWLTLKNDLESVSYDMGNPITSNGAVPGERDKDGKRSTNNRRFVCATVGRLKRKSRAMAITDTSQYRESTLINNRKNNRENGLSLPKRVKINQTITRCPFTFTIKWDGIGFYIDLYRSSGNPMHCYHSKVFKPSALSFPSRLLTQEQIDDTKHVVEATCNKAVGRNFMKGKFGRFINHIKVAYLSQRENDSSTESRKCDITNMLDDFQDSNEISFSTVSDVPMDLLTDDLMGSTKDTVTISTTKIANEDVEIKEMSTLDFGKDIEAAAKNEREEKNLKKKDVLFIAIAWLVIPAFRFFMLCPEVIWCDITSHTNNKGFHLLTFSCRTSVDKQVVFLWVWIPNQQRFSFRWVFQHAIPNLIPAWLCKRVKLIMKDGDPQQRNEIIGSLIKIFTNAIEGSCGYHIGESAIKLIAIVQTNFVPHDLLSVNMGYKKHVPGVMTLHKRNHACWLGIVRKIHQWIYSWMKPGYVEDQFEYQISKILLMQFISSAPVLVAAEGKLFLIIRILKWLRGYVFAYEELYLLYLRKRTRTFYTAHSSAHEVRFISYFYNYVDIF